MISALRSKPPVAAHHHLHHFEPSVSDVHWNYGTPFIRPGMTPTGPSIGLTYTLPYIDVKLSSKVHVNEAKRTITVTLDGTSPNKIHPMVAVGPRDVSIPIARPKHLGDKYTIIVKDTHGKVLKTGTFNNMLPM